MADGFFYKNLELPNDGQCKDQGTRRTNTNVSTVLQLGR